MQNHEPLAEYSARMAKSVLMNPFEQKAEVECRAARCKDTAVDLDERVDHPEQRRIIARGTHRGQYSRRRTGFFGTASCRAFAVPCIGLDDTLDEPWPVGFRQAG